MTPDLREPRICAWCNTRVKEGDSCVKEPNGKQFHEWCWGLSENKRAESLLARYDLAEGQVAALREALAWLRARARVVYDAEYRVDRILADTAEAAARHDERVRQEALEEAAVLCEENAAPDIDGEDLAKGIRALGDNAAVYKGRPVELTDKDISAISKVVLVALKRQVQTQLAEVEALLPKRKRARRRTLEEAQEAAALSVAPIKRRRGRPRKVQA